MKKYIIATVTVVLVFTLLFPAACAKPAEFQADAFDISPVEIISGDPTTVSVDIENIGGSEGTYTANLTIDGIPV